MKQFLFLIFFIFGFCLAAFLISFHYQLKPPRPLNGEVYFTIRKGEGFQEIARNLEEKKLIRSSSSFKLYLLLKGWADKLKPGYYRLSYNLSGKEIAKMLVEGSGREVKVTIPEGWTIFQIEEKLKETGVLKENDTLLNLKIGDFQKDFPFLKNLPASASLEGFLFPDTYRFEVDTSAELVAKKMLFNFENRFWKKYFKEIEEKKLNLYDLVKMASLIEGEIPYESDRVLVSGILWKRFKNNIPLQVDITLVYFKCYFRKEENCRLLQEKDLKIDSPYNTYLYLGFPPTPVANPSLNALESALYPQPSPYFYYLSDPQTGKTIFAKTLEEHNLNIKKYLKR